MINLENYRLSDYKFNIYSELLEIYPQLNDMTVDEMESFADSLYFGASELQSKAESIDNWIHILEDFIYTIQERGDNND